MGGGDVREAGRARHSGKLRSRELPGEAAALVCLIASVCAIVDAESSELRAAGELVTDKSNTLQDCSAP